MDYFWTANLIEREPFLPLKENDQIFLRLLAPPEEIIRVENAALTLRYQAEKDFIINMDDGRFLIPGGSQIRSLKTSEFKRPHDSPNSYGTTIDGKQSILWSEEGLFQNLQLLITYKPQSNGNLFGLQGLRDLMVKSKASTQLLLPKFKSKLKGKGPVNILLFGDSISEGGNCSQLLGLPPEQPPFGDSFAFLLQQTHAMGDPERFKYHNISQGGETSEFGKKQLIPRLTEIGGFIPDLVILGWGMNDSSAQRSPKRFRKFNEHQIKTILKINPDAEIILIASSIPNDIWIHSHRDYLMKYVPVLEKLAKKYSPHVMVANMTAVWAELLARKSIYDLTGNGINHPNDFGHRLYAEVLHYLVAD